MKNSFGKLARNWQGGPIKKKCPICNHSYLINKSNSKKRRTCSRKCMGVYKAKNLTGKKSPKWKGGYTHFNGYLAKIVPNHPNSGRDGYVRVHRLVMEKHLGRFLLKKEVVHHINHNKLDNRLSNLQLFSNHSKHMRSKH